MIALTRFLAVALAASSLVTFARADRFEDANHAFADGHYADSIQGYEAVLKQNGFSAPVLFDLANAEMRAGQVGPAILHYRRAQWLAPRDPDIEANLKYAEKQAGLAPAETPWTDTLANALSANAWAWLASAALFTLCAGVLTAEFRPDVRRWARYVNAVSALTLLVAATAVALRWSELDRAILPAPTTAAYLSPFPGAKKVIDFPAGQPVTIDKAHADFLLVKTPSGQTGWIKQGEVERIVPTA